MHGYKNKDLMEKEISLIEKRLDWSSLIRNYTPVQLSKVLGYEKGMRLASNIVVSNFRYDILVNYGIDLIFSLRNTYSSEWSRDWKNDAYLSGLCTIVWKYDESYKVLLEVYERMGDPPATLTFELADCYNYPPEFTLISEAEAEQLLKKSLAKELTYEAAIRLKDIYESRKELKLSKFYEEMATEAKRNNKHIEDMTPDILKKE